MDSIYVQIALPNLVGFIGAFTTRKNIKTWYQGLNKPALNPPNWVFGPTWTFLYTAMGVASYRVLTSGASTNLVKSAMWAYGGQLLLNFTWTPIFFGFHRPGLALINILGMWLGIAETIRRFSVIDAFAAQLLWPYLGWVSFATYLNAGIYWLNDEDESIKKD